MNAGRIARAYRWMEYASFGDLLQRCRVEYLDRLQSSRRALVLGDGDGRFTAAVVLRYPELQVDSIELSPEMLRLAERRLPSPSRVRLTQADARNVELEGSYDLIATHFFLDCLTSEETFALAVKVARHACPEALWAISEFHVPAAGWRRLRARLWIGGLYRMFRVLTGLRVQQIPDYPAALHAAGFRMEASREHSSGLLRCTLWKKNV